MALNPGESKKIELKEWHLFENPTDEDVKFRVRLEPASEGFEKIIYIVYGLARDGHVNEKLRTSRVQYEAI